MFRYAPLLTILTAGIVCWNTCQGQEQLFYPFRKFTQDNGLSSYNITKILQDANGFVWIGTQDGLNCFDGRNFQVFDRQKDSLHFLPGNNVTDIVEDRKRQLLWTVTSYGGITCIQTNSHTTRKLVQKDQAALEFNNIWVHGLAITDDILWVGTYEGLFAYDLAQHIFLPLDHSLKGIKIGKILIDGIGRLWVFCDDTGLVLIDPKSRRILSSLSDKALMPGSAGHALVFWGACLAGDGEVYAATNWGLRQLRMEGGRLKMVLPSGLPFYSTSEVFACVTDSAGSVWFSDAHHLYRLNGADHLVSMISETNNEADSWQSAIYALSKDENGRIWVGSEEGLSYFNPRQSGFEKFYRSYHSQTKIQHAFALCPVNDSIVYCGAANGLYLVNNRSHEIRELSEIGSCYLTSKIAGDRVLVSNSKGTFVLDHQRLIPAHVFYPAFRPFESDLLCCMVHYNDSIIVMASELKRGLYVWNTRKGVIKAYPPGTSGLILNDGVINALSIDSSGTLWVLSHHSIVQFDPLTGSGRSFGIKDPSNGRNAGLFFDMVEAGGRFWVAAYGTGLIVTDKQWRVKSILSAKEGLCNNGVYKVFPYHDSLLLVSSNNGLSVVHIKENAIKNYFQSDGLQSNAFEQFCGVEKDDIIYLGGVNGFTRISPGNFIADNLAPRLYITRIRMDGPSGSVNMDGLTISALEVPAYVYQTTVYFSGLYFTNPERTTYKYRIKELQETWNDLGNQPFINLIGLNPGKYTLEINAANEDGRWIDKPVECSLVFLPKWYQTWWFKLAIVVLFAGLLFALYRYRISQYKKQQQIRREIAGDLHDDLGSTLNTVKVLTHLAKRNPAQPDYLDQIDDSLSSATTGLRDMIWVLDDSGDSVRELMERIRKSVLPAITGAAIFLDSAVDEPVNDLIISKSEKRNLLLITREAVTNCIKYAACSRIEIRFGLTGGKLSLTIRDNGKGFDPLSGAGPDSNGLKNMKYRARQIHYDLALSSAPGEGTTIVLQRL